MKSHSASVDTGLYALPEDVIVNRLLAWMVLGVLIALPATAPAQSVGLIGGINSSSIKGDAPDKISYARSKRPTIGALGEFHLKGDVWLHGELLYTQRGTRIGIQVDGQRQPEYNSKLLLSYVSVPILVRIASSSRRMYATSGLDHHGRPFG